MPEKGFIFPEGSVIGIVGLGISNMPVAELFRSKGYRVILRDKKAQELVPGYECRFGSDYLENITEDVLFLAPVLRPDIPEILEAEKRGVYVTSDVNEYFRRRRGRIVAVTGSDGKTTTTTLIHEILKKAGYTVFLGGNIGYNLLSSLESEDENSITVCELSSFQLSKLKYAPDVAVVTNVSPNHLDWHTGMDEYIDSKKNIFRHMKHGVCVINSDDAVSTGFKGEIPVKTVTVSGLKKADVYFNENGIYGADGLILADGDILIHGKHNRYNYSEAIAASIAVSGNADGCIKSVRELAPVFPGVKHRCQFVRELDGVKYYNSSIDSSPTRTAAALNSFPAGEKLIVICGGYDKRIPLEPLVPLFRERAKAVVLMGVTGKPIGDLLAGDNYPGTVLRAADMTDAVKKAKDIAACGDSVILSPAAASFDMFKNFEQRGDMFIDAVNELKSQDGKSI